MSDFLAFPRAGGQYLKLKSVIWGTGDNNRGQLFMLNDFHLICLYSTLIKTY